LPPALRAVGSERLRPYGSETRRDYFVNILIMYVYLLQSFKDKKYYIGQADNIKKRLKEHNEGKVRSTKHRIPFRLIGYEEYPTRNEARWREYNLKKSVWQRKKFLASINSYLGIMKHYNTYKLRRKMLTENLSPCFNKYIRIADDYVKLVSKN